MQYLVREIKPSAESGESRVFKTLPDAMKHLQKVNNTERFLMGEIEGTLDQLERFLTQRLATVAVRADLVEGKRQWMITAFE
jgi:hypothetical protein